MGIAALWGLYFVIEFFGKLALMIFGGEEFLNSFAPWVTLITTILYFTLTPIFCALLYYDLRQRKEPLDLNLQNKTAVFTFLRELSLSCKT